MVARLTVDDSRFIQGTQSANQQIQSLQRTTSQAANRIDQSLQGSARGLDRLGQGAQDAGRHLGQVELNRNLDRAAQQAADRIQELQSNANRAGQSTREIELNGQLLRDARQSANQIEELRRNAQQAASSVNDIEVRNALERDLRAAQGELDRVRRSAEQASESTSNIGEGLQERMSGAFEGLGDLAGRSGESGGGNFLAGFAGRVGSLGSKAGPIGLALAGVAAIGLAAGAILANAISDGMEQESKQDFIQAKLGINEETARRMGIASGAAYSNGWGESVAANMDGLAAAMQSKLLTGEEDTKTMQGTIEQLSIVAAFLDEEIPAVARSAGQSIKTGIAKDGTEALDLLYAAQRNNLNVSGDLLDSFDEYSIQLKSLGLSGAEGWGLVSQAVNNGTRDTDVAIDALKEMKLRASDGTAAAADGFDKLGVSAEDFQAAMVKGDGATRDMFAKMLNNLHEIKDPQDKYNASLALFGTKFEDIQSAVEFMDLDTAVKQFGQVEGAARSAGDTMSSNTAASFDSAKRSIETSSADIKLALAGAFGPALTDLATWVTEHKPEIIAFFTGLADAGFATLDATLAFTSGALRAYAMFADGVGGAMAAVVGTMAMGIENAARFADIIPGMGDKADSLRNLASDMRGFADTAANAGDKARSMADTIDGARPVIDGMRNSVRDAGVEAEESARLMQALGTTVVEDVPDNKTIVISDNSPETVQRLQDLGMKVETTPNGIRVTATTDEAASIIHSFISQERRLTVTVDTVRTAQAQRDFNASGQQGPVAPQFYDTAPRTSRGGGGTFQADGSVRSRADGMIDTAHIQQGSGQGIYTRSPLGPVQYAEGETQWEAYIPGAPSKRKRSEAILQDVARRFGFGLVRPDAIKMANGGVVESFTGIASQHAPGLQLTSSYRDTNDYHGQGKAVDYSNGSGNTDEQLAWANYLADNYQSQLAELIYSDPRFTRNIKDGKIVDPSFYGAATMQQHENHVHAASKEPLGAPSGAGKDAAPAAPDTRTEREKIADQVIAEGKRRGISDKGIKAAVMTALAETDLQNLDYGMDGDNAGIMQQRDNGGWGTLEDRKDPTRAAGMFYDKLDDFDYNSMSEAEAAQKVQQSGTADGSNYAVKAAEADEIIAASNARGNGSQMTVGTTDSGAALATDGQRVFVTNWPGSSSSSYSAPESAPSSTPAGGTSDAAGKDPNLIWSGGFKVFENGGMNLPDQAGLYSDGADLIRFAEKGTGGESYIPHAPSKRNRSVAITRETARRFGYELVPMADGGLTGFGGYVGEKPGLKVPTTANGRRAAAYNAAAFGVGAAFALASGFDADGKFTGQFDTGSNSSSQLEKGFGQFTDEIAPLLEGILEAVKNKEPIRATVNVDQGTGMANIAIMKGGI
ncbi:phage tail tape measure protein [Rhodococcus qingshengii]|uniref:phage tail tape measure protein n=1 Tax=Rhodococcus qingshengii TaxID=334542 RepID=UPI003016E099